MVAEIVQTEAVYVRDLREVIEVSDLQARSERGSVEGCVDQCAVCVLYV